MTRFTTRFRLRQRLALPLLLAVLGFAPAVWFIFIACTPPSTIQTPAGKTAYTADQISVRIGELQNAAIQANATGGLPTSTTRDVVEFCVAAQKTLQATPAGWQQSVYVAWQEAKKKLPTPVPPALAAAVTTVDSVLAAFGGTP